MAEAEATKTPYPYLSFQTLLSLFEKMAREGLPARIDRSYLSYTSGINQSYLLSTLRWFSLINADDQPEPYLFRIVEEADDRPMLIGDMLRDRYKAQFALGQNATARQLEETFEPLQGSSKRKAVTFFLHACRYAQIELSPHFKTLRAPRGSTSTRKPTRRRQPENEPPPQVPPAGGGDTRHIQLRSGGSVALSVTANILDLSEEDTRFVLALAKALRDYENDSSGEAGSDEDGGQI